MLWASYPLCDRTAKCQLSILYWYSGQPPLNQSHYQQVTMSPSCLTGPDILCFKMEDLWESLHSSNFTRGPSLF